jgi:MFS family permease
MGWQGVQRGGRDERPQAVVYYRIYCWALVLLQLLMTAGGVLLLVFAEQMATQAPGTDPMEVRFQGGLMTIAGAVFLVPYLVAALLPERWWTWIAGLVIMALSLTSCCFLLPVTIPLLVYWVQPGTRAWFESLRGGPGR